MGERGSDARAKAGWPAAGSLGLESTKGIMEETLTYLRGEFIIIIIIS